MGPVAFESLDAGGDRDEAVAIARRLTSGGVRVMAMQPPSTDGGRWTLLIRSDEVGRARRLIEAGDDPGGSSTPGTGR
ncbi:MAG: hypothetical protein ACK5PP_14130 [Acidimicrobiales bacterium]